MAYKKLNSVLNIVNKLIDENIFEKNIVVDATLGNGFDSVKLLKKIGPQGKLYAFDVQEEAIENALVNFKEEGLLQYNYQIYNKSHDKIDLINEEVDFIIYNLGYLPGGDKSITTKKETTIRSISKGLEILKPNGLMVIVSYHGHIAGKEEKLALEDFLTSLDQKRYNCLKSGFINQRNNPPILYLIEKNN